MFGAVVWAGVAAVIFASDVTLDAGFITGAGVLVLGVGVSLVGWSLVQIVVLRSADATQNVRIDRLERVLDRLETVVNKAHAAGLLEDRRK